VRAFVWVLAAIVSTIAAAARSGPPFPFTGEPGSYAVGLKVVEQYDYSRLNRHATDACGKARPVQTLIWYPAAPSRAKYMTVRDYGNLRESDTCFDDPKLSERAKEWSVAMQAVLEVRLAAVRDAREAAGRFPVVIYAPSFSSPGWENADLCEYLASHGYVVLASASLGSTTRAMTSDLDGIEAQARDIAFLASYAKTLSSADTAKIAAAGYSWGGLASLIAAARDKRIKALIALDGSFRYFADFVIQARDVHPEQMTIPLLYFASQLTLEDYARYTTGPQRAAPSVLNSWTHGDLVMVHMLGLTHAAFSSMQQRDEKTWLGFPQEHAYRIGYQRADGAEGYAWMARYTLAFLDVYLKHSESAKTFLGKTPTENGVPRFVMAASVRTAHTAIAGGSAQER
jgi:pimeloyl-ACP methyl ester carboxylesterase